MARPPENPIAAMMTEIQASQVVNGRPLIWKVAYWMLIRNEVRRARDALETRSARR